MDMPTFLKSLVSSIASLTINGSASQDVVICEGDVAPTLAIEIDGAAAAGVRWESSAPNATVQNGGNSFTLPSI